ncbi:PhnD/SsuA/transferrin family substrate-binding protein [Sedimentitalea sp. JM2-8]|uniref:PhnD/SsuA/transferrin family substrate-binding protein n=1 Tax=Sedimentitalea xiamensis TaxID=3050037 RepID=A0ABT7FDD9_9RHOB|nr:PhnD/SsuA/transferrin family substrate-binding protein [Sedimentitalea xiamensis]MDK3073127.1 PhnD/SsuA/transferrin family substrate-binding protein [Sedimentitalea xiamensis]
MIASLGMYDMSALRPSNDRFWSLIRDRLGFGPTALTRDADLWDVWQSKDLVLAQTCGMPYRKRLHPQVTLVGTPDYGPPGCPPGYYRSIFVARSDAPGRTEADFAGGVFAYNEAMSQSGWAGPMTHLGALGTRFRGHLRTGAHAASAHAVANGQADLAGVDAVTWALLSDHDPVTQKLKVVGATAPTPGLPFVTSKGRDPAPIASAVRRAIGDLTDKDRAALHLKGFVAIPKEAYLAIPNPPDP